MRKPVVLITGAGGEIGHALVARLAADGWPIVTLDVTPLDAVLAPLALSTADLKAQGRYLEDAY